MVNKLFVIYTTTAFHCKWCSKLKDLLRVYGYDYYEKDLIEPKNKEEFVDQGFRTVPQVFIEEKYIGGYESTRDYLRMHFFENHPNKDHIIQELKELDV